MEDARITQMQQEVERLKEKNTILEKENRRLKELSEFNRDYIEMSAKLKAVEYISRDSERYIEKARLASVLGIPMLKEED